MRYLLYGNGGSANHGCEAIYRGTAAVLNEKYIIQSSKLMSPEELQTTHKYLQSSGNMV